MSRIHSPRMRDRVTVDGKLVEQYYLKDENGVEQKPVSGKNVETTIDLNLYM